MKRTRRVEVIRYTVRSTFVGDEAPLETDDRVEQAALEVLLGNPSALEVSVEASRAEHQASHLEGSSVTQRRRPLRFLKWFVKG